jgi:hypothetical protein
MSNARTAAHRRRRTPLGIAGRVAGGLVVIGYGLVDGYLCVLAAGLQCDESCVDDSTTWHHTADAWQWSALGWLGVACFACCVAFALSLAGRWPRLSAFLFGAVVATACAPWLLWSTG